MKTVYPRFLGVDGGGDLVWELENGRWTWGEDPRDAIDRTNVRSFTPDRYIEKYGRPVGFDEEIDRQAEKGLDPEELAKQYVTPPASYEEYHPTQMNAQGWPVLREQVTDQAAATWVAEKGEAAMKSAVARSRGEQTVDATRVDRTYALATMLGVIDGWVQGGRENHDALGHRGEPVGEECWNRFAPDDIRNMINDAAAEIGLEPVWTKGQ